MTTACTGLTARWCPVHGDCRCPTDESANLDDPDCPLHAPSSAHPSDGVPCAGWEYRRAALWLVVGDYRAQVGDGWTLWLCNPNAGGGWVAKASGPETGTAGQLAAEDALREIATAMLSALG